MVPLHPGLSIPVPRGRKGKRVKAQSTFDVQKVEWIRKYNPDTLLLDDSYRKHLKHQCNKSVMLKPPVFVYVGVGLCRFVRADTGTSPLTSGCC